MSTNGLCMVGFPEEENGFWFVVQSLSPVWLFVTPWTAALQTSPSFTVPQSLLRLMSIELMMSSNCHPVIPFSFCPQSFLALGSFPMSQLFASGGQSIGSSASASVLPMNIQGWFPLGSTGLISLQPKRFKNLLQHHSSKASILRHSAFFMIQLSYLYMTTGKTIALAIWPFVSKVITLLFNMLSRSVIAFLSRSKHLLISWLKSL